jgi:NDP-sugar pyrophosphorylase family protein
VRALILAAGLGTRLRPLTYLRAKAAIPVNGVPLARRIASRLAAQGFTDLVVNLHHHPATITSLMGDGSDLGVRVRYSWEQPVLGSAGGPRHALPLLVDDDDPRARFLLVNGDTLTDADLRGLVRAHEDAGDAAVTMALIPNPEPMKYGGVSVRDGRVTGFTRAGTEQHTYHFIGLQIAETRVFDSLPDGVPAESVNQVYPAILAENPRAIGAYIAEASFQDIGSPADYLHTSLELGEIEGSNLHGARVHIDPSAAITRTVLWDDVKVGANAHLDTVIVGDGAVVPANASYARCVILPENGRKPVRTERVENGLLIAPFAATGR